jgi:hypothetical protein
VLLIAYSANTPIFSKQTQAHNAVNAPKASCGQDFRGLQRQSIFHGDDPQETKLSKWMMSRVLLTAHTAVTSILIKLIQSHSAVNAPIAGTVFTKKQQ